MVSFFWSSWFDRARQGYRPRSIFVSPDAAAKTDHDRLSAAGNLVPSPRRPARRSRCAALGHGGDDATRRGRRSRGTARGY